MRTGAESNEVIDKSLDEISVQFIMKVISVGINHHPEEIDGQSKKYYRLIKVQNTKSKTLSVTLSPVVAY